eukprot:1180521-Prorocentrum_minimum.AAC.2
MKSYYYSACLSHLLARLAHEARVLRRRRLRRLSEPSLRRRRESQGFNNAVETETVVEFHKRPTLLGRHPRRTPAVTCSASFVAFAAATAAAFSLFASSASVRHRLCQAAALHVPHRQLHLEPRRLPVRLLPRRLLHLTRASGWGGRRGRRSGLRGSIGQVQTSVSLRTGLKVKNTSGIFKVCCKSSYEQYISGLRGWTRGLTRTEARVEGSGGEDAGGGMMVTRGRVVDKAAGERERGRGMDVAAGATCKRERGRGQRGRGRAQRETGRTAPRIFNRNRRRGHRGQKTFVEIHNTNHRGL